MELRFWIFAQNWPFKFCMFNFFGWSPVLIAGKLRQMQSELVWECPPKRKTFLMPFLKRNVHIPCPFSYLDLPPVYILLDLVNE